MHTFPDSSRLYVGNVLEELRRMPTGSVHCVVTSPPYFGLRNYNVAPSVWGGLETCDHQWVTYRYYTEKSAAKSHGSAESKTPAGPENAERIKAARWRQDDTCALCGAWRGQLGLEPTPELFVDHLVQVFTEVHRVLRDDGTLWLNMGDSYNNRSTARKSSHQTGFGHSSEDLDQSWADLTKSGRTRMSMTDNGLKEKDLIGVPWMLAFALRTWGWYLRSDVVWAKGVSFAETYHGACLPEAVKDRPSKSHEYLFLLTKSKRYYYDQEAVREPLSPYSQDALRLADGTHNGAGNNFDKAKRHQTGVKTPATRGDRSVLINPAGRNLRSVWCVKIQPFKDAHYAVMPEALAKPCIQAGTSEKGVCSACGAPWVRQLTRKKNPHGILGHRGVPNSQTRSGGFEGDEVVLHTVEKVRLKKGHRPTQHAHVITMGWAPSCHCGTEAVPSTVLDPFFGAGTTGLVANKLGRQFVGVELNQDSANIAINRLTTYQQSQPVSLFDEV